MAAQLASIQVALPRTLGDRDAPDPMDHQWTTGFFKTSVTTPIRLSPTGLDGDGQADLINHGGPDKAVCVYSADHYPFWRDHLSLPDFPHGAFGENFTISGLTEPDVCISDVYRLGPVELEVSQPRQPCWKLARRWRIKNLTAQVVANGRTGWYFRVLQSGIVEPNIPLELVSRPNPDWTLERANKLMHHDKKNLPLAAELTRVTGLSLSWIRTMKRRSAGVEMLD